MGWIPGTEEDIFPVGRATAPTGTRTPPLPRSLSGAEGLVR